MLDGEAANAARGSVAVGSRRDAWQQQMTA